MKEEFRYIEVRTHVMDRAYSLMRAPAGLEEAGGLMEHVRKEVRAGVFLGPGRILLLMDRNLLCDGMYGMRVNREDI